MLDVSLLFMNTYNYIHRIAQWTVYVNNGSCYYLKYMQSFVMFFEG